MIASYPDRLQWLQKATHPATRELPGVIRSAKARNGPFVAAHIAGIAAL
jgi:hypothetical protein